MRNIMDHSDIFLLDWAFPGSTNLGFVAAPVFAPPLQDRVQGKRVEGHLAAAVLPPQNSDRLKLAMTVEVNLG